MWSTLSLGLIKDKDQWNSWWSLCIRNVIVREWINDMTTNHDWEVVMETFKAIIRKIVMSMPKENEINSDVLLRFVTIEKHLTGPEWFNHQLRENLDPSFYYRPLSEWITSSSDMKKKLEKIRSVSESKSNLLAKPQKMVKIPLFTSRGEGEDFVLIETSLAVTKLVN